MAKEVNINITAIDKVTAVIKKVTTNVDGMGSKMGKALGGMKTAFAAAIPVAFVAAIGKITLDISKAADAVAKMSEKVGLSTDVFQELSYVAKMSGGSAEIFAKAMKTLSINALEASKGVGTQADSFKMLGIDIKDSNGELKDANVLFLEASDKISTLKSQTERVAIANRIFGKSGTELLPVLNQGSKAIKAQFEEARRLGAVFSPKLIAQSVRFQDTLQDIKYAWGGIGAQIAEKFMPAIQTAATLAKEVLVGVQIAFKDAFVTDDAVYNVDRLDDTLKLLSLTIVGVISSFKILFEVGKISLLALRQIADGVKLTWDLIENTTKEGQDFLAADMSRRAYEKDKKFHTSLRDSVNDLAWAYGVSYKEMLAVQDKALDKMTDKEKEMAKDIRNIISSVSGVGDEAAKLVKLGIRQSLGGVTSDFVQHPMGAIKPEEYGYLNILSRSAMDEKQNSQKTALDNFFKDNEKNNESLQNSFDNIVKVAEDANASRIKVYESMVAGMKSKLAAKVPGGKGTGLGEMGGAVGGTAFMLDEEKSITAKLALDDLNSSYKDYNKVITEALRINAAQLNIVTKIRDANTSKLSGIDPVEGGKQSAWNTYADEVAALKDSRDKQLITEKQYNDYIVLLRQERENSIKNIELEADRVRKEKNTSYVTMVTESMSTIGSAIAGMFDYQQQRADEDTQNKIEYINKTVKGERRRASMIAKIEADAEKESESIKKKQMTLNLLMAIANSAGGVASALNSPWPASIGFAAAAGIAGAIQVGIITSQLAQMASGGVLGGQSNSGDRVAFAGNAGEVVMNKGQQNRLLDIASGRVQPGGGGGVTIGGDTIIVNGNLDQAAATQIKNDREKQLQSLRDDIRVLSYRGQLQLAV